MAHTVSAGSRGVGGSGGGPRRRRRHQSLARGIWSGVLDALDALVVVLDREGRIRSFNRACEAATGYAAWEVIGCTIWDRLIPPAEVESVKQVFRALVRGERGRESPSRHENLWLARDGSERLVDWSNSMVRDRRGRCRYVIGTGIDVTDRRRAERGLRDSDERFRAIFEQAAVGIAQVGLDGRWLRFNDALCRIVGYTRRELSLKTFQEITHPDDLEKDLEQARRLRDGEIRTYSMEKRYVRRDGSTVWAQLTRSVGRGESGAAEYFVAVVEDVSQRVEARRALLEGEARLRGIFETAADAIITIDEQGDVESLNPAAVRMFGYAPAEIVGHNVKELMPEPYRGEHDSYLRRYRETGVTKVIGIGREVPCRRKDGSTFPCDLSVGEVRLRDRRIYTGILRDATQRKRAEEMRLAKEAADAANRSKDSLLAVVAHDLRTPLSAIRLWSQFLARDSLDDTRRREAAACIQQAVQVQQRLVDDLLDVSRIVGGTFRIERRPLDLGAVIRAAAETLRGAADAAGIDLEVDTGGEELPVVGDALRLQQVLWNLLSNAIRFTPPGGRVRVTVVRGARQVEVQVSDTGCGIRREDLPRVFDRYWQAESAAKGSGLGLGLAIVRFVVQLHGGSARADSEGLNRGATFSFFLPLG